MNAQIQELALAYGITAVAMLAGLLLMRAGGRAYWRWPVYSMMAMVLGVVLWNLARKHLLPAQWAVTHAAALYFGALTVYAVVGLSFGMLFGKLTGAGPGNRDKSE